MRMVSIRGLSGAELEAFARSGELVGVTKSRVLIGVMIPITPNWVAHVIEHNWSRVMQSVTEGELEMAADAPMTTLDNVLAEAAGPPRPAGWDPGAAQPDGQPLRRFMASIGALESEDSDLPPARNVRVGDLSAAVIEQAGEANEVLAVTHDGVLLGIVVPVTQRLVGFLVGKNISRVLYNVSVGEKEIESDEPLTALEEVLSARPDLHPSGVRQ